MLNQKDRELVDLIKRGLNSEHATLDPDGASAAAQFVGIITRLEKALEMSLYHLAEHADTAEYAECQKNIRSILDGKDEGAV